MGWIRPIPTYSSLIQYIPAYSSLFQPMPAFTPMPNLQFEMPNCAFYPQLGILSVSSLLSLVHQVQCSVMQYVAVHCRTVHCRTVHCRTVHCRPVQCIIVYCQRVSYWPASVQASAQSWQKLNRAQSGSGWSCDRGQG